MNWDIFGRVMAIVIICLSFGAGWLGLYWALWGKDRLDIFNEGVDGMMEYVKMLEARISELEER